jgi:hypothetical protein
MANITQLYQQLQEGKGTKSDFVKAAVSQYPNYVSVLNSFDDTVKILKSKSLISESHKLTTAQIIDRLNPYTFKKGVEVEIEKAGGIESCDLEKIREKVAKALTKNPNCYDAYQFANATEMNKRNSKHQYQPVKNELKDKENQMRKPKGFSPDKANTKASKKENRKGKPKGVKIMKEDVTLQAGGNIPQEENLVNTQVILRQHPDKQKREGDHPQSIPATVVEQNGNIIHVQLEEDGKVYATTRSVIDTNGETPQDQFDKDGETPKNQDKPYTKDQLDQAWKEWDKKGMGRISAMEEGKRSSSNSDELSRVKGLLDKAEHSQKTAYENRIKILELLVHIEKKSGKDLPLMSYGENVGKYLKSIGYEGEIKTNKTGGVTNRKDIADAVIGSDNPEKLKEIVGKLKEFLSKKKSLKKGIKEEDDTGVVRISKKDPKKADKIKDLKARDKTYELY